MGKLSGFKMSPVAIPSNVFLIGMMGSWKTTVGRKLAVRLGLKFVDLDDAIEAASGLTIADFFHSRSEQEFREIEARELEKLAQQQGQVIATGGGVVILPCNREILLNWGQTFLLQASPQTLAGRIRNKKRRPLLQNGRNIDITLKSLWQERKQYYEQSAHKVLLTDSLSPGEITEKIIANLEKIHADN